MRVRWMGLVSLLACVCVAGALAEEMVFFQSSSAGSDAWSWGGAKIKSEVDGLLITETNPDGAYGDVFPSDRFPYIPSARITLNVGKVLSGTYTLQALCFKGSVFFKSVDIVKDAKATGDQTFRVAQLGLPPETQSIMFKLWVGNQEGASIKVKELKYALSVLPGGVLVDERFDHPSKWTPEDLVLTPGAGPFVMGLAPEKTYGSMSWESPVEKDPLSILLVHVAEARSSVVTVQLDLLGENGEFIRAVDAVKDVGTGWHGVPLATLDLPAEAAKYKIKIWMSAGVAGTARLDRLLVLK